MASRWQVELNCRSQSVAHEPAKAETARGWMTIPPQRRVRDRAKTRRPKTTGGGLRHRGRLNNRPKSPCRSLASATGRGHFGGSVSRFSRT
jgi:hypothetical protein